AETGPAGGPPTQQQRPQQHAPRRQTQFHAVQRRRKSGGEGYGEIEDRRAHARLRLQLRRFGAATRRGGDLAESFEQRDVERGFLALALQRERGKDLALASRDGGG